MKPLFFSLAFFLGAGPFVGAQLGQGVLADADIAVLVRQALISDAARSAMSSDALGRAANVRPDVDVARDVQAVLDLRLSSRVTGLSVSCRKGVVVLAGSASRAEDVAAASALAAAVPGARSVENRMSSPEAAGAAPLPAAGPAAGAASQEPFSFLTHDRLAGAGVRIAVDKGVVTLRGTVNGPRAKEMATATARLVIGVRSVVNEMSVRPGSRAEDERLEKLILRRIEWSTELSSTFRVEVRDGIARLSGTARGGPGERNEAVRLAATTQGILVVDDQIVVR